MAGLALGGEQIDGAVADPRRRGITHRLHEQLPDGRVIERAFDLARHKLVVTDVDDLAVRMAHNL